MNTHLNILPVILLLAGCGSDFGSNGSIGDGAGGSGGDSADGATGGVTGVTGGATGVTGGSGGALVGTGGTATGGQPVGTGGAACTPPVVTDMSPELPTTIVWDSYVSQVHAIPADECLTCLSSPCATCDAAWWPVSRSTDGLTITAGVIIHCAPMPMTLGACGSTPTTSCTTWSGGSLSSTFTFELVPKADGSGYTTLYRTLSGATGSTYTSAVGTCDATMYRSAVDAYSPFTALLEKARDTISAIEWPCGG